MSSEFWVRLWRGQAASLLHYQGDTAMVYVAGEELTLPRATWSALPPYEPPSAAAA
ncbi:hypothetical protein ACFQU7_36105 [Pseudoroseomonas wenyumeiae]